MGWSGEVGGALPSISSLDYCHHKMELRMEQFHFCKTGELSQPLQHIQESFNNIQVEFSLKKNPSRQRDQML